MSHDVLTGDSPNTAAGAGRPAEPAPGAVAAWEYADFASKPLPEQLTHFDPLEGLPPPQTVKAYCQRRFGTDLIRANSSLFARRPRAKISAITGDKRRYVHLPRVATCGFRITRQANGVGVYQRPDRAYGRISGVCVCGQSLCCPVCAPRIAAVRSEEVAQAFAAAKAMVFEKRGGKWTGEEPKAEQAWTRVEVRLVTYTVPHRAGTSLGEEIDVSERAWRHYQSGRKVKEREEECIGYHLGRECTHGVNGWHYHRHMLRYDQPGTYNESSAENDWLDAIASVGRRWRGAEEHAYDCGLVDDEARAAYCAKLATSVEAQALSLGREVGSGATKGRNIATLLAAAIAGDTDAAGIWLCGVRDICERKVASVRWSRGLAEALKIPRVGGKSDRQVAADEVLPTDKFLGALTAQQWRGILRYRAEFALLCAANQGAEAVNQFLAGLELGQLNEDAPPPVEQSAKADNVYRDRGLALPTDIEEHRYNIGK